MTLIKTFNIVIVGLTTLALLIMALFTFGKFEIPLVWLSLKMDHPDNRKEFKIWFENNRLEGDVYHDLSMVKNYDVISNNSGLGKSLRMFVYFKEEQIEEIKVKCENRYLPIFNHDVIIFEK